MTLWQVTSYHGALGAELTLRRAVAQLRARYGRRWARRVPADLVWMLRSGVFLDEAYAAVTALTSSPDPVSSVGEVAGSIGNADIRHDTAALADTAVDQSQLDEVVQLNQRHWACHGRPVSAETVVFTLAGTRR